LTENKYNVKIVNMVASANFNVELDLFALAREIDTIEYEPEQFPGAILKLSKAANGVKASLLLFKNGKVICTGARSEKDVEKALMSTVKLIEKYAS
jgi:transcription initiation factor TFIID TATA-box-binding protein